jgi:hypothetical protein
MPSFKKDQHQICGEDQSTKQVHDVNWCAQTFVPSISANLDKVHLFMWDSIAFPANAALTIAIKATDINGKPTGADLASQTITNATFNTMESHIIVSFDTPTALTQGVKYAIVISAPNIISGSDRYDWYYAPASTGTADYYPSGDGFTSADSGSNWTALSNTNKFVFVTEMSSAVAQPALDVSIFGYYALGGVNWHVDNSNTYLAQTFQPSINSTLKKIRVALERNTLQIGGNVTVEVQTTSGGLPTGTSLTSESISDASIQVFSEDNSLVTIDVTFSTPVDLTSGTTYAIVLKFPNALGTYYYRWAGSAFSNEYTDGKGLKSTNNGSSWIDNSIDFLLGTFMEIVTTTTQTVTSDAQILSTATEDLYSDAFCGEETNQNILSDASIIIVSERLLLSDTFCGEETDQNINSDASIGITTDEYLTSDAFCGEETQRLILSDSLVYLITQQTLLADSTIYAVTSRLINSNTHVTGTSMQFITANSKVIQAISQQVLSNAYILINEPDLKLFTSAVPSVEIGTLSNPLEFSGVIAGQDFIHPDNPFYLWNDKGGIGKSTDANAIVLHVLAFEVRDEIVGYSNANPSQTFTTAFTPVVSDNAVNHPIIIKVNNVIWTNVASLLPSGMLDEVYTFDPISGLITFGDGVHGKIPPLGAIVQANYTPIDIQHGLEVEMLDWFGVRSTGVISNPVSVPLERQLSIDANTVQVVHQHLTSVVAVYLDTDPNGLGTNYYTGGTFDANLGVITLGTPLPDPKTYVFIVYSYEIADDSEPSYTQIGVISSHQFANSIPSNNAKLLYFRLSPPATANPSGPMNIYFRIRIDYQA